MHGYLWIATGEIACDMVWCMLTCAIHVVRLIVCPSTELGSGGMIKKFISYILHDSIHTVMFLFVILIKKYIQKYLNYLHIWYTYISFQNIHLCNTSCTWHGLSSQKQVCLLILKYFLYLRNSTWFAGLGKLNLVFEPIMLWSKIVMCWA